VGVKVATEIGEGWEEQFHRWLEPFLDAFGHKVRRYWAPVYLRGLLAPGERKSIEPLVSRVAPGEVEQVHHFVATSRWSTGPIEEVLMGKADALVDGDDAHLIVDDTAVPKKGEHSVGVAHQHCGALGKQANCQCLVSVTLARDEVPVPIALRLHLPEGWASDAARRKKAAVPEALTYRPKWEIALEEVTRIQRAGVRFGDVLADAGYGCAAEFRHGLSSLGLRWAVGIQSSQLVYSSRVRVRRPKRSSVKGRPPLHGKPTEERRAVTDVIGDLGPKAFRTVTWRTGTKGALRGRFAAIRVRPADGTDVGHRVRLPSDEVWLIAEARTNETKYYLCNYAQNTSLKELAATIKARWSCEQAHQQLKEELGLDHFEGRSWHGLHHHAVLTMVAFAFLQQLRWRENKA
jgi:SRSO17 transposase